MFKSAYSKRRLKKMIARWKRRRIKIIAVVGARKSGKDVLVEYLQKRDRRLCHLRIADGPLMVMRVLDLPSERRTYHALFGLNAFLYPFLGEAVFKRRVARIIDREKPRYVVVEALRTEEEYQEFVIIRGAILIGVEASPEIRYQRVLGDAKRDVAKKDEAKLSFKEFLGNTRKKTGEFVPGEREISRIVRRAHFILTNNYETRKPFYQEIEPVARALGLKKK